MFSGLGSLFKSCGKLKRVVSKGDWGTGTKYLDPGPGLTRSNRHRYFGQWFGAQTTIVVQWRANGGQHPGPRANVKQT
jgi:hypothetical protein